MRVEVWSDVVCPWCYIGKRRFEKALAAFPHRDQIQVIHRSFQLDPSQPKGRTQSRDEVLQRKYGWSKAQLIARQAQMHDTATAEGLHFKLGGALTGNTADAHQLIHLGRERGMQDAVIERLYRAYFEEGRSLFDHDSLVALAAEAGLDPDEARAVLAQGKYTHAVAADGQEAHELGATGVPFFVIANRYGISGAQTASLFAEALARAWAETEGEPGSPDAKGSAAPAQKGGQEEGDAAACTDDSCAVPSGG